MVALDIDASMMSIRLKKEYSELWEMNNKNMSVLNTRFALKKIEKPEFVNSFCNFWIIMFILPLVDLVRFHKSHARISLLWRNLVC
jgi:hypothetical protein